MECAICRSTTTRQHKGWDCKDGQAADRGGSLNPDSAATLDSPQHVTQHLVSPEAERDALIAQKKAHPVD